MGKRAHRNDLRPLVVALEGRTLLSSAGVHTLATVATHIDLGTPVTGRLDAGAIALFEVDSATGGRLLAQVHGLSGEFRLSLLDGQGRVLLTSDGQSFTNPNGQIELHIPAGTDYLEVQNRGASGAATYTLTTSLFPSAQPFQPVPLEPAGARPFDVVSGDFNGDGYTDLATVNQESYDVSVLLGNGDGTFQDQGSYAVGTSPYALVSGDFNGDGYTDLAVANFDDATVSILICNGDGTFQAQKTYKVGASPGALVSGDFNGDGHTDLAVANRGSDNVSILLGKGDGTFQEQSTYRAGSVPGAITVGDFNGDGRTDLAVANASSNDVSILLGNGDGTFQAQTTYQVGSDPYALVTGDFDSDGRTDLAVANASSNDVSILLGNGDGTFREQTTYATGSEPISVAAADFNGDGHTDLAVANLNDYDVSILLGNGDGTFQDQVTDTAGSSPIAVVSGDFDGDGHTDLAVANADDNNVLILLGRGDGSFPDEDQSDVALGSAPIAVAAGDFNGDGHIDLATADWSSNTVSILLGNGDGSFQPPVSYDVGTSPDDIVAADFDGDGRTDLAVVNADDGTVSVLLGNGDGTFQDQVTYDVGASPFALVSGDFNGDGHIDLATANNGDHDVSILLGNGDGTFQEQAAYPVGQLPFALDVGDFNGDGHIDLATANNGDHDVSILLGNGDGTFREQTTYQAGQHPVSVVSGDFNRDGRTDLAVANYLDRDVSILLGRGDGTFQAQTTYPVGYHPFALAAGDFNGDGRTDLAVSNNGTTFNSGAHDVSILLGRGDGSFQPQVAYRVGVSPVDIVAADYNGDKRTDLAVVNQSWNDVSVLLGNGDGTFQDQVTNGVNSYPTAVVSGDFNGDGRPDLATVNQASDDVSILLGNGDGSFQPQVTYPVGTSPFALVSGDFNGDGRTDLAAANYDDGTVSVLLGNGDGTFQRQTTYKVGSSPDALAAGDFNGDGHIDLAVANHDDETVSILLGKGDGTFQRQMTYDVGPFPRAVVVGDFNGDGRTDLAVANQGSDNVSILLGRGDGGFRNPVTYQVDSGPFALAAGDFNGDGHIDLAAANKDSNKVSILLGRGDGTFQAQTTYGVGSLPRGLVAGDFNGDGRTDLAAANGNSNDVSVLLGNGDGTFQEQTSYQVGFAHFGLVAADLNGDGRTDLAVPNTNDDDVSVLLNLHDALVNPSPFVTPPHATPLVADLNGDGTADVLVIDAAGKILYRQGIPGSPGGFQPPEAINPGRPARDIALVRTAIGPVVAAVSDRADASGAFAVSLYRYARGGFGWLDSFPTGSLPAQIVAGDLTGDGLDDLVVRNVGDGTLSVFFPNESGPISPAAPGALFLPPLTLRVGVGASDAALIDTTGRGVSDIVVTNKLTGLVSILRYDGRGIFDAAGPYRAGAGLLRAYGTGNITSLEGTTGVVAGRLAASGPDGSVRADSISLMTINPGSNSIGLIPGLGNGRFANPATLLTTKPAQVIRAADLNGDGLSDLVVVTTDSVDVYMGRRAGGFLPPVSYDAGPSPSGLNLMDVNGDGRLDLLIGNPFGDVLVLLGEGDGTFQPYRKTDRSVALAVADLNGSRAFIFADAGLDRVSVQYASGGNSVVGDRDQGLLAPGAVQLADLDGNGIKDLIVANSGSNNVLVYPGLDPRQGRGQFGPSLNGHGFFTGTNPAGITVADVTGDGRPDLIVANKGSNDVSVLINRPTPDGGFTFTQGPRLKVGSGPVATVVQDINGDGIPDLLVSNSGSNNVMLLPGRGGGFFSDQAPTVFPVGTNPGPIFVGDFNGQPGLVAVNRGSNDLTLITNFNGRNPLFQTIATGGDQPAAAVQFTLSGGFDGLAVANNGSGSVALFTGGPDGLSAAEVVLTPDLPSPTSLALESVSGNQVEVYGATAGAESATLLTLLLTGGSTRAVLTPAPGAALGIASLVPLRDTDLALVATLLPLTLEAPSTPELNPGPENSSALLTTMLTATLIGPGQSGVPVAGSDQGGEEIADPGETPVESAEPDDSPPSFVRSTLSSFLMGLEEKLEQFRRRFGADHAADRPGTEPAAGLLSRTAGEVLSWLCDPAHPETHPSGHRPGAAARAASVDRVLEQNYVHAIKRAVPRAPAIRLVPPGNAALIAPPCAPRDAECQPVPAAERIRISLSLFLLGVLIGCTQRVHENSVQAPWISPRAGSGTKPWSRPLFRWTTNLRHFLSALRRIVWIAFC
jgi:predicted phosphodiesterase